MPQYNPPDDKGYMGDRKRGASLGRSDKNGFYNKAGEWVELTVTPDAKPMTLVRVRMCGAYDSGGAYWGLGEPLYYYSDATGSIDGYVRGATRDAAKAAVRASHPNARFYR